MDPYFNRPEISNSDLSEMKNYFMPQSYEVDCYNAFRMGTLIDCMITEPDKVDVYKMTCMEYSYTQQELELCREMKKAFYRDATSKAFMQLSSFQHIFSGPVWLSNGTFRFNLAMRCKYDFWMPGLKYGGDIKSTVATTQKQFEEAYRYFDYDRSRAVYMTLSGAKKDMVIGISKVNCKIFKIPITRDSELFKSGMEKFRELAFKYWCLFDGFKLTA